MAGWNLIGHEWAVTLLARDLAADRVRHAYLFAGPPGVGKRTLAVRFAQALNCLQPPEPGAPCLACRPCTLIGKNLHPDVPIVQSEIAGGTLKIEQVREIERQVALAPFEARYRVPLLLRFHEATLGAANALLKTLEEPPPQVVLLLTAEAADRLLPTIVSRCETLNLRPLPVETVQAALVERWNAPADRAALLAHLSGGRVGWAVRLSGDAEALERRAQRLDELLALLRASRVARFAYAAALAQIKDKSAVREVLDLWVTLWRDVLLVSGGAYHGLITNVDRADAVHALAQATPPARARSLVESIRRTQDALAKNANPRLALETLMLDLPHKL